MTDIPTVGAGAASVWAPHPGAVSPTAVAPATIAAPQFQPRRSTQPISGSCAIHDPSPTTRQSLPMEMLRKAEPPSGRTARRNTGPVPDARPTRRRACDRAHGGHHLVGVGDSDDAPGQRDLLAGEPARIAAAVEAFVVMLHRNGPLAQPGLKRPDDPRAFVGMAPDAVHLPVGEPCRLGKDLGWDHELADVVEQRRPAQSRAVGGRKLHLVGDEVGEDPHPFGMAARLAVVNAQCSDEFEHPLHVRDLAAGDALVVGFLELPLKVTRLADAARDGEPFRRAVGKEEREVEQCREREAAVDLLVPAR